MVGCQSLSPANTHCMSRQVAVIGSSSLARAQARCTLHVARCSLLVDHLPTALSQTLGRVGQVVQHPASSNSSLSTGFRDSRHRTTLRARCSYTCFITWTIVVLMSNSNIRPVARTTFFPTLVSLSAPRTLRWDLEGPATAQPEPTKQPASPSPRRSRQPGKQAGLAGWPEGSEATLSCHRAILDAWCAPRRQQVQQILHPVCCTVYSVPVSVNAYCDPLSSRCQCTEARVRKPSRCMT